MPIRDYQCNKCKHIEENVLEKMNETTIKTCPKCQEVMIRRISLPSKAKLKGSGFYETDYK